MLKRLAAGAATASPMVAMIMPAHQVSVVAAGLGLAGAACFFGAVGLVAGALTMNPFVAIAGGILMTACAQ